MQSMLEGMWNKLEYELKNSKKLTGQLEECSYSRVIHSVLNGRTFKYILGKVGFICFLSPVNFLTAFV